MQKKRHLIREHDLDFQKIGSTDTAKANINNLEHYENLERIEKDHGTFQHLDKTQVKIEETYDWGTRELLRQAQVQQGEQEFRQIP